MSGREPFVRFIKLLSVIVSLMLLINAVNSFGFGDNLDMYKESFQALLEQAVGYQKRTQNKIENMSRLLKEARSITNEDELDTFMENLKEMVDEAHQLKIEDKHRIALAAQQFDLKLLDLYPQLQNLKMLSNGNDKLTPVVEKLIKTLRTFLNLKKKLLNPESEDIPQSLKEVVNILKRSQHKYHEEL